MRSATPAPAAGPGCQRLGADIVYLASIDFPHVKARAIQIINTCHALARAGSRVTLVVGRRHGGPLKDHLASYGLAPHPRLRVIGLPAFRLASSAPSKLRAWYTRFWNWSYLTACLALLPVLLQGHEIILARDYRLAWLVLKLSRWRGVRLAFEVHGLPSAELLDTPRPTTAVRREAKRRRRLERSVFDGAWRLLPITDCLRHRLLHDYGASREKVFTVPDASRTATADLRPRTMDGSASRHAAPKLIYVGQLYPWKGVDLLLQALVEIPTAELSIVGGLPDDSERFCLAQLAGRLGIAERVRFHGPRPYQQVAELLGNADVALLPLADGLIARCFTSPLKLFDYLSAGLPIVAVDFPTVREVLRHEHNALLVPPNDPQAMAAAIKQLLDQPELAERLATQAGRDAGKYTWERRAESIMAALAADAR